MLNSENYLQELAHGCFSHRYDSCTRGCGRESNLVALDPMAGVLTTRPPCVPSKRKHGTFQVLGGMFLIYFHFLVLFRSDVTEDEFTIMDSRLTTPEVTTHIENDLDNSEFGDEFEVFHSSPCKSHRSSRSSKSSSIWSSPR